MGAMLMKIVILLKENKPHITSKKKVRKMLIRNFENFHENFYGGDVNQNHYFIQGK